MKLFTHDFFINYFDNNTGITTAVAIDVTISCRQLKLDTLHILVQEYINEEIFTGFPPTQHPMEPNEGITLEYWRGSNELKEFKDFLKEYDCGKLSNTLLYR